MSTNSMGLSSILGIHTKAVTALIQPILCHASHAWSQTGMTTDSTQSTSSIWTPLKAWHSTGNQPQCPHSHPLHKHCTKHLKHIHAQIPTQLCTIPSQYLNVTVENKQHGVPGLMEAWLNRSVCYQTTSLIWLHTSTITWIPTSQTIHVR